VTQFLVGERVVLDCDNPFLDGRPAVVLALTDYGAVVSTGVGSGQWRALLSELAPCRESVTAARDRPDERAREAGYSGDACGSCGSFEMIRDGKCLTCRSCGSTSGGCS
jgi:hypothetical protein